MLLSRVPESGTPTSALCTNSLNHKAIGVSRDFGDHLVQSSTQSRTDQSKLHRTMMSWVLNRPKDGDISALFIVL